MDIVRAENLLYYSMSNIGFDRLCLPQTANQSRVTPTPLPEGMYLVDDTKNDSSDTLDQAPLLKLQKVSALKGGKIAAVNGTICGSDTADWFRLGKNVREGTAILLTTKFSKKSDKIIIRTVDHKNDTNFLHSSADNLQQNEWLHVGGDVYIHIDCSNNPASSSIKYFLIVWRPPHVSDSLTKSTWDKLKSGQFRKSKFIRHISTK